MYTTQYAAAIHLVKSQRTTRQSSQICDFSSARHGTTSNLTFFTVLNVLNYSVLSFPAQHGTVSARTVRFRHGLKALVSVHVVFTCTGTNGYSYENVFRLWIKYISAQSTNNTILEMGAYLLRSGQRGFGPGNVSAIHFVLYLTIM